jgi:hypothetical protein
VFSCVWLSTCGTRSATSSADKPNAKRGLRATRVRVSLLGATVLLFTTVHL